MQMPGQCQVMSICPAVLPSSPILTFSCQIVKVKVVNTQMSGVGNLKYCPSGQPLPASLMAKHSL